MWHDEAELANVFLEGDRNRRSSGSSSPGYHFTSTMSLKRNLTATFDRELPSVPQRFHPNEPEEYQGPFDEPLTHEDPQPSRARPPLPVTFPVRPRPKKAKKNFSVYLRIRPLSPNHSSKEQGTSTIEILKNSNNPTSFPTTIRTYPPNLSNAYRFNINRQPQDNAAYAKEFNFDRVIGPNTTQEFVYSTVAAPMIKELLGEPDQQLPTVKKARHKSALLFSYGITNAGKTHTILGDMKSTNQADWGIIPRTINDVFQQTRINAGADDSKPSSTPSSNLSISFFEVYNENIFDLMPTSSKTSKYVNYSPPALKVRECRGQIFVRGLSKHKISTVAQGIELTKQAHKKRHTSSNNLNSDSSRSHFVCQIQIVPQAQASTSKLEDNMSGYSTDEEATERSRHSASTIWIVDLAGSERSKRTKIGGTRQKESTKINNSLMTLMRCLNAMKKDGKKGFASKSVIPFRESKLTHIFMGHLTSESAAQTAMMVNVNPSIEDFDETQHVLAYSRKAKLIEIDMKEYGKKRKEFFGEEYDQNGRKKPRLGDEKNPTRDNVSSKTKDTLMTRIVKKLSPKKYSEKQDEMEGRNVQSSNDDAKNKEIEKLEKSLKVANEKVASLESQNLQLLDELDRQEDQIRAEVSMEMENRLRETRRRHNEKYERLKSQIKNQASNSNFTVSMNRAGSQLEELMDKIDECEKEMIRMTRDHQETVSALHTEMEELKKKQTAAIEGTAKDKIKITSLEEALRKSKETVQVKEIEEVDSKTGQNENTATKDINVVKSTKCKRNLRPRKPLGNSTNYASRVFAIDGDY